MVKVDDMFVAKGLKDLNLRQDSLGIRLCEVVEPQLIPGDFTAIFLVKGFKDELVGALSQEDIKSLEASGRVRLDEGWGG